MGFFWANGPMFVKHIVEMYDEPRPHFTRDTGLSLRGSEIEADEQSTIMTNAIVYFFDAV